MHLGFLHVNLHMRYFHIFKTAIICKFTCKKPNALPVPSSLLTKYFSNQTLTFPNAIYVHLYLYWQVVASRKRKSEISVYHKIHPTDCEL